MRFTRDDRREAEKILRGYADSDWEDATSRKARVQQQRDNNRLFAYFGFEPVVRFMEPYSDEWVNAKLDAMGFPKEAEEEGAC